MSDFTDEEINAQYKERWGMTPDEEYEYQKRKKVEDANLLRSSIKDEVVEVYDEPIDGDDELSDEGYFVMKQFFGF